MTLIWILIGFVSWGAKTQSTLPHFTEISLAKELSRQQAVESTHATGGSLQRLKWAELQRKEGECTKVFSKAKAQFPELKAWIYLSYLNCHKGRLSKPGSTESLNKIMIEVAANEFFGIGPWRKDLQSLWWSFFKSGLNNLSADSALAKAFLDRQSLFTKEEQSLFYRRMSEAMFQENKILQAKYFAQISLRLDEDLDFKRLSFQRGFIPGTLPRKKSDSSEVTGETQTELKLESKNDSVAEELIWNDLQNSFKEKQFSQFIQGAASYHSQFPGGANVKKLREQIFDIFLNGQVSPASQDENLKNLEALWVWDLSKEFYRRGQYANAEVCLQVLHGRSPPGQGAGHLLLLGKSSIFVGHYERAISTLNDLLSRYPGTEEAIEGSFRLGLLQFRLEHYKLANVYLRRGLNRGGDRYDLTARYWLIRSLQKDTGKESEMAWREEYDYLLQRYPFSYFTLKLKAENNENKILQEREIEPTLDELQAQKLILTVGQEKQFRRAQHLAENGWQSEALAELRDFVIPQTSWIQKQWAELMAHWRLYSPAITSFSKAADLEPTLRRWSLQDRYFPLAFAKEVKTASEKHGVSNLLILSLMRQESAFFPQAVSSSNAFGLMQMISETAQEVARKEKLKIEIPADLFLPEYNVQMGASYLAQMVKEFSGQVPLALAAYNAGPTRLRSWINSRSHQLNFEDEIWMDELPWSETTFYVKSILRNAIIYRALVEKKSELKPNFWTELITFSR